MNRMVFFSKCMSRNLYVWNVAVSMWLEPTPKFGRISTKKSLLLYRIQINCACLSLLCFRLRRQIIVDNAICHAIVYIVQSSLFSPKYHHSIHRHRYYNLHLLVELSLVSDSLWPIGTRSNSWQCCTIRGIDFIAMWLTTIHWLVTCIATIKSNWSPGNPL